MSKEVEQSDKHLLNLSALWFSQSFTKVATTGSGYIDYMPPVQPSAPPPPPPCVGSKNEGFEHFCHPKGGEAVGRLQQKDTRLQVPG